MLLFSFQNIETLVPLILLISSIAAGILLEVFLMVRVRKILAQNNWLGGGKVLKAFRGITFVIFLGIGVYLFVQNSSLHNTWGDYFTKGLIIALIISICTLLSRIAVAYLATDPEKGEFQG